jgi:hypothetical protein
VDRIATHRELVEVSATRAVTGTTASATGVFSTFTTQEGTMDRLGRSALSSFHRVQEFLAPYLATDGAPDSLGAQAKELDEVIARLTSEAVDQEAGQRFVRVHSESQRRLREALYGDHMLPISRVAREVFGTSGVDRAFRMPHKRSVNQTLLAAAGAMAEAAGKNREVFLKHGLPQDFVDQLTSCAAALETARTAKFESGRRRVTATAGLRDQVKRGRKAVRLLNAILEPRLARDPELHAAWRSAKRVPPQTTAATMSDDGAASVQGTEKAA